MSRLSSSVFILLLYLLPLQDLLASLFYGLGMPALFIRGIILTKEMLVLPLGFYIAVNTRLRPGRRLVLLLLLYASALMLLSPIPITERLIGYRTYLLIFFSFVLGESIGQGRIPQKRFFQHIKIVLGLVITFGLLEHLVLPTTIWTNLFPIFDMKRDVLALTGGELGSTGLPLNAYSELGKRMLGPFDEPLYMAYFTVLLLNFLFARYLCRKAVNPFQAGLGLIVIFLTQTRAIILGLLLSVLAVLMRKRYWTHIVLVSLLISYVVVSFYDWFSVMVASTIDFSRGSTPGHILAYTQGILTVLQNPFGVGIGAATTSVALTQISSTAVFHTENAYVNTAIEIGLPGLIILFAIFLYLFRKYRTYLRVTNPRRPRYVVVTATYLLLIQFAFAGFVAPHILTARILIPFMIILGWGHSIAIRWRRDSFALPSPH